MTRALITLLALCATVGATAQQPTKQPARRAPAAPAPALVPADAEQLAAAAMTYFGDYACELDQSLRVSPNPRFEGYVDVRFGKQVHTMKPILSSTGVLRLEDVRGLLLLLQIAPKSMLLDVRAGRRLVDDCMHDKQVENRRTMAGAPAQPGLDLAPAPADAAASAPAAPAATERAPAVDAAPRTASPGPVVTPVAAPTAAAPASASSAALTAASAPTAPASAGR
jgi:hypothetical protein